MATKISVFNTALGYMGKTALQSPEDDDENGRTLRSHWVPAVDAAFESGGWNFAMKRVQLSRTSPAPTFGFEYYYNLPSDWQRIIYVSATGFENDPLLFYEEEDGKIATNADRVYLKYVSNLSRFEVGKWSQAFADYVAGELADRSARS